MELSFFLDKDFVNQYTNRPLPFGFNGLGEVVFYRTYSREKEDGTQESWTDVCERVINGMYSIQKNHVADSGTWNYTKANASAEEAFDRMWNLKWSPPGRGIFHMGAPFVHERKVPEALQNCFSGSTSIVTKEYGPTELFQLVEEDITVWTRDGWEKATVKSFGEQETQSVTFVPASKRKGSIRKYRSNVAITHIVTKDHRWILADGTETNSLSIGDAVLSEAVDTYNNDQEFFIGFMHGLVFGDGNKITHQYINGEYGFELRACSERVQNACSVVEDLFDKVNTERPSANGDPIYSIRTGVDLKEFPINNASTEYIAGFIDGWCTTDASYKKNGSIVLASSKDMAYEWLLENAASGGYVVSGISYDNRITNYGERSHPLAKIVLRKKDNSYWVVKSIERRDKIPVFCPVVPSERSFLLSSGIYTGNCAFCSTKDISKEGGKIFGWFMEMLMLGIGVGFDTSGAGTMIVKGTSGPDESKTYTVEDSREGWSKALEILVDAYLNNEPYPFFNYDFIREAGMPIRGFGGTSSGYKPLSTMINAVRELLSSYKGELIDSRLITDIFNHIGGCVIAGNVRRSAEIALGDMNDEEFLSLKDYELNPERMDFGWASNNTIYVSPDMGDYIKFTKRILDNGEPGFYWLPNANNYARMNGVIDTSDKNAVGINPCLTGDTLVATADERLHVRIDEIEDGTPVWCSDDDGNLVIRPMRHPRVTGYGVPVYRVVLDDGTTIRATGNHKFRMRGGEYIRVDELQSGDSLVFLSRYIPDFKGESRPDQYYTMSWLDHAPYTEHVELAKYYSKREDLSGYHVHHKDGDKLNNSWENLDIVQSASHLSTHSLGGSNPNAIDISNDEIVKYGVSLARQKNRRFSTKEWQEYALKLGIPSQFTGYREERLGTVREFSITCAEKAEVISSPNLDTRQLKLWNDLIDADFSVVIVDSEIYVEKVCEGCGEKFVVPAATRETSYCSIKCYNKHGRDYSKNKKGLQVTFGKKKEEAKKKQTEVILDLKSNNDGSWPMRKEWEQECKRQGVAYRLGAPGSPFPNYSDLKEYASEFNHRVVSVEPDGYEDVWNGTVDDYHNFFIGGQEGETARGRRRYSYINNPNCGEQPLEHKELCTLVELYPTRHESLYDFLRSIKFAYLYGKTVTLANEWIGDEDSRRVMTKNRRIGLSMTGIAQFVNERGIAELIEYCEEGYSEVQRYDRVYSRWFNVNRSIRTTSVKPSGTVSLLAGVTPGVHYPESQYYIRRIRLANNSPLLGSFTKSGYKTEPDLVSPNTVVVEFPVCIGDDIRGSKDVSLHEQLQLAALMQRHWADNSVSCTVTFDPKEVSEEELSMAIQMYQSQLKAISFLPVVEQGAYAQMPYEEITKEEYEEMIAGLLPLDIQIGAKDRAEDKFCDGVACEIEF